MTHEKELAQLKKILKEKINGKFMVRKDGRWKGDADRGIHHYNVYFDTPTTANKNAIDTSVREIGWTPGGMRIEAGTYGFIISFRTEAPKE
jgi:hypothetical protein